MIKKFGFQAYTIRDYMKDAEFTDLAFKKMKALGYDELQTAGCAIPVAEYAQIAKDNGIKIIGTHENVEKMMADPEAAMEFHRILGTTNIGTGGMGKEARESADGCRRFCERVNKFAEIIHKEGFRFTYHNHHHEFGKIEGNTTLMDILVAELDPVTTSFCLDTCWVQCGGGDVRAWIEKLEGRIDILHLKDVEWVLDKKDKDHLMYTSIGDGNLNWKGIIESAEKIGVKHYIVEQDSRWFENNPFKSAERSANYIKANLM